MDTGQVPPTPGCSAAEPLGERWKELAEVAPAARALLGPQLRELAEPYLSGLVAVPESVGTLRFIHHDICPDHLIVDPATGRLAGLIDFTDALVGDPVLDFVGLIGVGGYDFIERVVAAYDLGLGEAFWEKLRWLARMLTLLWLGEAASVDPAWALSTGLTWVARAFDQPG